ncbi:hypothetical protein GXW78_10595 [Roseomonas terrae]|uniref:Uncharacterized protein n=1 Tax=Neoroseomonas terrae TaxID=424799 RepID=A0ABS5EGG0_9PROT|nr:hypothetical protein [Neoroseomonas terrae]MBR0650111.1 hypothetical protein [Neoroseomonas terrae]
MWNKTRPGQGSAYRSQHELICVFKIGSSKPINTFGSGDKGGVFARLEDDKPAVSDCRELMTGERHSHLQRVGG